MTLRIPFKVSKWESGLYPIFGRTHHTTLFMFVHCPMSLQMSYPLHGPVISPMFLVVDQAASAASHPGLDPDTHSLVSFNRYSANTYCRKNHQKPMFKRLPSKKHDHVLPSLLHSDKLRILQTLVGLSRRQRLLCHGLRNLTRTSDRNLVQFGNDKLGNRTENPGFNGNHACHAHGDFIVKLDFGRVSYFCWDSDQDSNRQQRASTHAFL